MKRYIVKVLKTGFVTHNVNRLVVNKPHGYPFTPGQATAISSNQSALRNLSKPFSIVAVSGSEQFEFFIKNHTGYDGLTERLWKVRAGEELILHKPFGSIRYKGKGVFIAGGTGIVPFMAIFRELEMENQLAGNALLFANRSIADIFLKAELEEMLGSNYVNVVETAEDPLMITGFIGSKLLKQYIHADDAYYYICGPDKFTIIMIRHLLGLGVDRSRIVFDEETIVPPLSYLLLRQAIQFN
ncbi:hypothetical protein [Terrimonas pollutisoli]|uniref:hypothetical protein n=1 Tax=Terrimonas pollutisoli TaxID=3034147 RepID=UPI0023ED04D8|nr:hypothetical protein [Terrimonas sp. H1YJ31]